MYYDSATGLYYDPNTQYHYNSETGLYCYYDATQQAYISVDQDGNPVSTAQSNVAGASKGAKSKKGDKKSISAKKIAKDMERWAKSVNAAKSAQQQQLQAVIHQEREASSSVVTSAAPESDSSALSLSKIKRTGVPLASALQVTEDMPSLNSQMVETLEAAAAPPAHRVPLGADMNPAHTDWDQLACLLCKRKFNSKEMLVKHQQFSDLHKVSTWLLQSLT